MGLPSCKQEKRGITFEVSLCLHGNTSAIRGSSPGSLKGNEGNIHKEKHEGGESSTTRSNMGEKWMCASFIIISNGSGEDQRDYNLCFYP